MEAATGRYVCRLLDRDSGASMVTVTLVRTPPGEGSPEGVHIHTVDQVFYVVSGTMSLEVAGVRDEAGPGSLVIFPARVPHRSWNDGAEPTVHVAIASPVPPRDVPFAIRVTQ